MSRLAPSVLFWVLAFTIVFGQVTFAYEPLAIHRRAVVVGVNQVRVKGSTDLEFARNDARVVAKLLKSHGYEVRLLTDDGTGETAATKENVLTAMKTTCMKQNRDDLTLIYFAGHGHSFAEQNSSDRLFLIDTDTLSPEKTLGISDILEVTAESKSTLLLVIDASRDQHASSRGTGVDALSPPINTIIFFACERGSSSFENKKYGHGVFTQALLEGLEGKAGNDHGEVRLYRLADFLTTRVPAIAREMGEGIRQNPQVLLNLTNDPVLINDGKGVTR